MVEFISKVFCRFIILTKPIIISRFMMCTQLICQCKRLSNTNHLMWFPCKWMLNPFNNHQFLTNNQWRVDINNHINNKRLVTKNNNNQWWTKENFNPNINFQNKEDSKNHISNKLIINNNQNNRNNTNQNNNHNFNNLSNKDINHNKNLWWEVVTNNPWWEVNLDINNP